jgi:hypothetical protein
LEALEAERDALQEQLQHASTPQKPAIAAEIKAINKQITAAKAQLNACIANTPPTPVPLTITLRSLFCQEETSEFSGSDEPYVIVYTADLTTIPAPRSDVAWSGVLTDVDKGEGRDLNIRVWGFNGAAQVIRRPEDVILLVALMEHDESSAASVVSAVRLAMQAELVRAVANRLDRARMVQTLTDAMKGAIGAAVVTGVPNRDDLLSVRELPITPALLRSVGFGGRADAFLDLGGDGSSYRFKFELTRA